MEIIIEPSSQTPGIEFHGDGNLLLKGRSNPENANELYEPLFDFVNELESPRVKFDVKLKYFNTASSKMMMQLFNYLEINKKIQDIRINWYYEEGDEDSREVAEIFEENLSRSRFTYITASLED